MNDLATLACWEVHLGLFDDAEKHYREALRLGWHKQHLQFIRSLSPDDIIVRALVKAGRDKQAESLLLFTEQQNEWHAKNASESGETNSFIAEQMAKRFTFLAERRRL